MCTWGGRENDSCALPGLRASRGERGGALRIKRFFFPLTQQRGLSLVCLKIDSNGFSIYGAAIRCKSIPLGCNYL